MELQGAGGRELDRTDVRGQDVCVADSCGHHFDDDFVGVHFLKADGLDGEGAAGRGYDEGRCEVVVGGLGGGHGGGVEGEGLGEMVFV